MAFVAIQWFRICLYRKNVALADHKSDILMPAAIKKCRTSMYYRGLTSRHQIILFSLIFLQLHASAFPLVRFSKWYIQKEVMKRQN
ncbi:hypothetical protein AT5A_24710 [Agrobacterium tumefaciens 5A]|nr:hypothetical protein AT5A_24710 [Agrobacterium tumefaciens 5A]